MYPKIPETTSTDERHSVHSEDWFMSKKDYRTSKIALLAAFAAGSVVSFSSPSFAQNEDITAVPFMVISAPVHLSGRPIGIEAKYTYGSPIPNKEVQVLAAAPVNFVHIPVGTSLQVALISPVSMDTLRKNPLVQARLVNNVTLPSGQIIPTNTLVVGHIAAGAPGITEVRFDQIQLSNGTLLPISASIVEPTGTVAGLDFPANTAVSLPAGQVIMLQLNAPAQVAVQGGVL
jgi:hypothetical protein